MTTGILHTLKMIADVKTLMLDVIQIAKTGVGMGAVFQVIEMLKGVRVIIGEVPGVVPELKDLDSSEAARLAEASYDIFKSLVEAIVK